MAADARSFYDLGIRELKLKVGGNTEDDIQRILAVRETVGSEAVLRLDANQGWTPKQAVHVVNSVQRKGANLDFVEQPVVAHDLKGMHYVKQRLGIPVVADESVFSPVDVLRLIENDAADGINIKLAKCGGIAPAVKIAAIAEAAGLFCMIGCMMESHAGLTAAAHFGSAIRNVIYADLDVPLLCSENTEEGGVVYNGNKISFSILPGLGIVG
jgi:L-alanine-DL-glutamate epimerase-like enolase superfamily enzyme